MIKSRPPARRKANPAAPTPATTNRLVAPAVLDDKQLKQIAGGNTGPQALPKGTW